LAALFAFLLPNTRAQTRGTTSSKPSDTFATLAAKAVAARDAERLDEAAVRYRRALVLRPSWAEGWWSLGTLEYDQDHYAKAAAALQKFIALRPEDGTAHAMLGLSEFELGHDQLALAHIEKGKELGLQKNPDLRHVVFYHEGILLQRKGSFQAAQEALEELCLQAGPNDKAANALGMTMLRSSAKDLPVAGSVDAEVVLRVGRAECLAGEKKYDEARPLFEQAVKEHPDYPNVHYAFGLFLIEVRDVAGAVDQFKQEIANHPENVIARLRIAAVVFKEDSAAGIPYAEEAVKLDPRSPYGHYILGLLRLDVDDYLKAIPELEIAQKGMPQEPKIYLALGTAYSRSGRKQDAARARATFQRLTAANKSGEGEPSSRPSDETAIPLGNARPQ
jgi:tetratricopeptide (TPR) repeat protein